MTPKKKWYSYFVVTDEGTAGNATGEHAPRRAGDVVPEDGDAADPQVTADSTAAGAPDIGVVYESARIVAPAHGYTVLKVAEMVDSEHIRALPADVKRKSVLVALDAAGVKVAEIVEDAVRRDRALDAYERALEKHLEGLRAQVAAENERIEKEIAQHLADLRARTAANRETIEREEREFRIWVARKHDEEEKIANAVSYFVSENPITASRKGDPDVRQA